MLPLVLPFNMSIVQFDSNTNLVCLFKMSVNVKTNKIELLGHSMFFRSGDYEESA